MNKYCNQLNVNFKIEADLTLYKNELGRNHKMLPNEILGKEMNDWLFELGLKVELVEYFYLRNKQHKPHCDSVVYDSGFGKINYITGGKDSFMVWYEPIGQDTGKKMQNKLGYRGLQGIDELPGSYRGIDNVNQLREVFSKHLQGFYLVNVGVFHDVIAGDDDRYCLSVFTKDLKSDVRLGITQLQERMKKYII
tara:strand:+ start:4432 stop:5013 length:582 start_codon:yes stop_codon:yes gene_type:complete